MEVAARLRTLCPRAVSRATSLAAPQLTGTAFSTTILVGQAEGDMRNGSRAAWAMSSGRIRRCESTGASSVMPVST